MRNPELDSIARIRRYLDKKKGLFFYFRTQAMQTQLKFSQMVPTSKTPLVFLHGNPHIDNYARTSTGCGMVDFDRSRMGPYSWDLVRLTSSLWVHGFPKFDQEAKKRLFNSIREAYLSRIEDPNLGFEAFRPLMDKEPKEWELSTRAYLAANKRWAKKMRMNLVDPDDKKLRNLFVGYCRSRGKLHFLEKYNIVEVGAANGSMGKPRYLMVLESQDPHEDCVLLDFKEVYDDPDTKDFYNPYKSHGHRMVEASSLYAPGVEQRIGYTFDEGQEYWVRQVPPLQMKIKWELDVDKYCEFAHCVATQLGMAHRRSLLFVKPEKLVKNFKEESATIFKVSEELTRETIDSYVSYKKSAYSELLQLNHFLDDDG